MARNRNSDTGGRPFGPDVVAAVWAKGSTFRDTDPNVWRRDVYGATLRRQDHGVTTSQYGWEIDHLLPVAHGSTDALSNLQPIQWATNRDKSDTYPWRCP